MAYDYAPPDAQPKRCDTMQPVARPASASAANDAVFDMAMLQRMLEKAMAERDKQGGALSKRLGLGGWALETALMFCVPDHPVLVASDYVAEDVCEEQAWIRELLLRNVTYEDGITTWFAAIIARRSMEASHLWEDLGLPDRSSLSRLLLRHFAPLAERNINGMRWKRFFYRMLCEEEGYDHCTSPTCASCCDVDKCFEPESVEGMIARAKSGPR